MSENNIQLLDCTLRDGSYIVDGKFGGKTIGGIIKRLQDAGVEIIECGWLKDANHQEGSTYYHTPADLEKYFISPKRQGVTYVAMIDYNRYDITQLPVYDGKSVDAIRVVFPRDKVDEGIALVEPIRKKGYRVFLQAANTPGYSDEELLNLINKVNEVKPESISVVDTFGTMYPDDMQHILDIFAHKLDGSIKIGLHSHNNQQLSFANAMVFVNYLSGEGRKVVVDASLCGMGRGAGNACTELVTGFLNSKYNKMYDIDIVLDTIDIYMSQFLKQYEWGYSIPYFISGIYSAHVNNIAYLIKTHKTRARDLKNVIERLEPTKRIIYDYDNLEKVYVDYQNNEVEDGNVLDFLKEHLSNKEIVLIVPGKSVKREYSKICEFINSDTIVIGVNAVISGYKYDYLFFSNTVRYDYAVEQGLITQDTKVIITSNIKQNSKTEYIVNYNKLISRGWDYFEVSIMMLLKLLHNIGVDRLSVAGLDGFEEKGDNYSDTNMESNISLNEINQFNQSMKEMLCDFRNRSGIDIKFITNSRFDVEVCK